jgi:hypothetical protein
LSPKVETCSVTGCGLPSKRSISIRNLAGTNLKVSSSAGRVNLCKDHYKQFKKETKGNREVERARFKNLRVSGLGKTAHSGSTSF